MQHHEFMLEHAALKSRILNMANMAIQYIEKFKSNSELFLLFPDLVERIEQLISSSEPQRCITLFGYDLNDMMNVLYPMPEIYWEVILSSFNQTLDTITKVCVSAQFLHAELERRKWN